MATMARDGQVTVTLTADQLTAIRVACLLRLDRLRDRVRSHADDAALAADLQRSYDGVRAMMDTGGPLHTAARELRLIA